MRERIEKLKAWQVAVIFAVVGLAVFFTGLNTPFQNDDHLQIVNNAPVHSIINLPQFFSSSTFFNGEKLTGVYYRPLMTTTFSLVYTFFGANPLAYHIVQLAIYVAGAFVLYLVFKRFLHPVLSLVLALIFLVHPINSQVVFSIPTMQDALMFLFGMIALWLLTNRRDFKGLLWTAGCLLAALFSKESGILFVAVSLLYLILFEHRRVKRFLQVAVPLAMIYLAFKINAVGLIAQQHGGPINEVGLPARLLTAPSVALFYLAKFVFPQQLSLAYYWVYPNYSVEHVLLPLIIDMAVVGALAYVGFRLYKKSARDKFAAYLFFVLWFVGGMVLYLHILPGFDMTACETWFYFAMAGLLGAIGVAMSAIRLRFKAEWLLIPAVAITIALGIRTGLRGLDYKSQYNLALCDLAVSGDNYAALTNIAQYLNESGKYQEALDYARRSIDAYPTVSNYTNLGVAMQQTGDYSGAIKAYEEALKLGSLSLVYENLALVHISHSAPLTTTKFFQKALSEYPRDFKLWLYFAVFEGASGAKDVAKVAVMNAAKYGAVPQSIYNGIMYGQPFTVPIAGKNVLVK